MVKSIFPQMTLKGRSLLPIIQGGMGIGISAHRLAGIHAQDPSRNPAQGEIKLLGVSSKLGAKTLRIAYALPYDFKDIRQVVFSLYDCSGRQVWKKALSDGFHAGKNDLACNNDKMLSSGVYLLRMSVIHKNNNRQVHFSRKLSIL